MGSFEYDITNISLDLRSIFELTLVKGHSLILSNAAMRMTVIRIQIENGSMIEWELYVAEGIPYFYGNKRKDIQAPSLI